MGIRGELFSTKVLLQNRSYFFNVKENRLGDLYLNIVESKNRDTGGFERQSVILFADDLAEFLQGFDESLRVLEKAAREKKRSRPEPRRGYAGEEEKPGSGRTGGRDRPGFAKGPERGKRVLVKKGAARPKPAKADPGGGNRRVVVKRGKPRRSP
jgi:hypothetical protein